MYISLFLSFAYQYTTIFDKKQPFIEKVLTLEYTVHVTIEAVDENGTRLQTDMLYVDRLNAGQKIRLTAFEFVEQDKINQFKTATFKVLEIDKFNF